MKINPKPHIIFGSLSPVIALDLETTGLQAWKNKIDLIAIKTATDTFVLETDAYEKTTLTLLFARISKLNVVVMHNAKFDVGFIYKHHGILLRNAFCTEMGAEMCENGRQLLLRHTYAKPFSLVSVLHRWLGITHGNAFDKKILQKSFVNDGALYKTIPVVRAKQIKYAAEDVEHLIPLYKAEMDKISELQLEVILKLEQKLLPVLVKMEQVGCLIDKENWIKLVHEHWEPERKEVEERLDKEFTQLLMGRPYKYTVDRTASVNTQFDLFGAPHVTTTAHGNPINYSSNEQLLEFVRFLNVPIPTDKHGKESLEEGGLQVYLTEHPNSPATKFFELLLEYRKISKMVTTYGELFLDRLDDRNYIHTEYTQTKVETGRNSSKNPNLQNIPKPPKNNPTKDIRRFFKAAPGFKFVTCDMSGAEVAIAADYSQEPILLDALLKGADMHSDLASVSFSILFDEPVTVSKSQIPIVLKNGTTYVPEELRDTHKSVVFAKFYKGGAARVYGVLSKYINEHWPEKERMRIASKISDALDEKMPKLSAYLTGLINQAKKNGFLRTSSFGRIRFFQSDVYGEAANAPIQGTNAEAIKMAMVRLDDIFEKRGNARIVMVIHDELVCEVREDLADEFAKIIQKEMADALSYFLKTIKGGASVSISDHWKK